MEWSIVIDERIEIERYPSHRASNKLTIFRCQFAGPRFSGSRRPTGAVEPSSTSCGWPQPDTALTSKPYPIAPYIVLSEPNVVTLSFWIPSGGPHFTQTTRLHQMKTKHLLATLILDEKCLFWLLKAYLWVVKNAEGLYPRLLVPSATDGASLS